MDRQVVYAGSIPLDTDLLNIQRYVMTSIGALARAVLGDTGLVDGLACSPGEAPFSVVVGPGSYTAPLATDYAAFGSLPPDPTVIVQTALHPSASVLQLGPPPGDGGQVLCWLVQVAITQVDDGAVALPYWNAGDPRVPFSGPGNSGLAQTTRRALRVLVSAKASGPQPFPIGHPPEPDPGYVGLFGVTTFRGKPGIETWDIVPYSHAPTLRYRLPQLPPGPVAQAAFGLDTLWQVPAGVRHIRVRAVGGGGGGGGGQAGYSGGGGGAGGCAEVLLPVLPGELYPIVVGAGGAGASSGGTGGTGGATSFGSLVRASGGEGGGSSNPDSHGGAPGRGLVGGVLQAGGYGGDGAVVPYVPAGNGGGSVFGGGGRGSDQGGLPSNGIASGSGGGGGYGAFATGGSGAPGLVVIEY